MANTPSSAKRHRQNLKRRTRNRDTRSTMRTAVKTVLELAQAGDFSKAEVAAKRATKLFDKAAIHGVIHKNNAQRHISRLYQKLNSLQAAKA